MEPGDIGCGDLAPTIGVTATPVIDPATNIAYLTHKTYASGTCGPPAGTWTRSTWRPAPRRPASRSNCRQRPERAGPELPADDRAAAPGSAADGTASSTRRLARTATSAWQGWVFGVSTAGAVKARWVADETGDSGAGIWQSGAGLTSDGPGTILLSTGNGGAPIDADARQHPAGATLASRSCGCMCSTTAP